MTRGLEHKNIFKDGAFPNIHFFFLLMRSTNLKNKNTQFNSFQNVKS